MRSRFVGLGATEERWRGLVKVDLGIAHRKVEERWMRLVKVDIGRAHRGVGTGVGEERGE